MQFFTQKHGLFRHKDRFTAGSKTTTAMGAVLAAVITATTAYSIDVRNDIQEIRSNQQMDYRVLVDRINSTCIKNLQHQTK